MNRCLALTVFTCSNKVPLFSPTSCHYDILGFVAIIVAYWTPCQTGRDDVKNDTYTRRQYITWLHLQWNTSEMLTYFYHKFKKSQFSYSNLSSICQDVRRENKWYNDMIADLIEFVSPSQKKHCITTALRERNSPWRQIFFFTTILFT